MDKPYGELGLALKDIRHKKRETIAEVSMAVEIDIEAMARIENGLERPSEEVLMLLISHFDMADDDAVQLWQMAKYDRAKNSDSDGQSRTVVMLMAVDSRIIYSDSADVNISKSGVVMNFLQTETNGQRNPIARIGMSYEQAHEVLDSLKEALSQAHLVQQPKALPAKISNSHHKKTSKS